MNIQALTQLGLSEKEASVYLACLDLESAKASDIAKKACVIRDTAYFILDGLKKKGLVKENIKSGVKLFWAENPYKFVDNLQAEKDGIEEKIIIAEEFASRLMPIFQHDKKFIVNLIDGPEQVELLQKMIIKSDLLVRSIASHDELMAEKPMKQDDIRLKFRERERPIITISASKKFKGYRKNGTLHEFFLSDNQLKFKGELTLFGDKMIFSRVGEPTRGLMIEDKDFSSTLKVLFDLALEETKRRIQLNRKKS